MIKPDGTYFRLFYRSPLGHWVVEQLTPRLVEALSVWQKTRPENDSGELLAMGYPFPLMHPAGLTHVHILVPFALTLASVQRPFQPHTMIHAEPHLPFDDHSIAGAFLYHALEFAEQPKKLLEEVWRVLEPSGRLLLMVPHRKSRWSTKDSSPFGHGLPYTESQLLTLVEEQGFTLLQRDYGLPLPPRHARLVVRLQRRILGWMKRYFALTLWQRWGWVKGGVLIVEVEKRLYAVTPDPANKPRLRFQQNPEPELATRSRV